MALFQIGNAQITIQIDSMGAELKSLKKTDTGMEYMWSGNPAFWKRTSPVLFPLVGGLHGGEYVHEHKKYPMSQHGFARDMEFTLKSQTNREIWFRLESNEGTLEKYPYAFILELGYELQDNEVIVKWKVKNPSEKRLDFSIGGHPAFCCPIREGAKQSDYRIWFDAKDKVISSLIKDGLVSGEKIEYPLENGALWITEHLFDGDALVIEHHQAHQVALVQPDGTHYLTMSFDAPLFGVWSPPGKRAPFICIEPWYGRCDAADFTGTWSEREWGQHLEPGARFEASYRITV
ncbi:MAG: aldose 1-epimerase family protein [Muribaculaceae bacterium]|nr:aldose 1-epimerase family protein [Muribaculaceae bacterium]